MVFESEKNPLINCNSKDSLMKIKSIYFLLIPIMAASIHAKEKPENVLPDAIEAGFESAKKGNSIVQFNGKLYYTKDLLNKFNLNKDDYYKGLLDKALSDKSHRKNHLISYVMMLAEDFDVSVSILKPVAISGLNQSPAKPNQSPNHYLNQSIKWCLEHKGQLNDKELQKANRTLRRIVIQTQDASMFWLLEKEARKSDQLLLKHLYKKRYSKPPEIFSCRKAFLGTRITRAKLLLLLIRFNDPASLKIIQNAISQSDNIQQRAWGAFVASHSDKEELIPYLAKILDDRRIIPEAIGEDELDPSQKGGYWQVSRTRICDVAVRAIFKLANDNLKAKWPFQIDSKLISDEPRSWAKLRNVIEKYPYTDTAPTKPFDPRIGRYVANKTVGFKEDQIEKLIAMLKPNNK